MHFPFLVLNEVVDGIILGTDWEAEVSATRFPPSKVIGVALTDEARATYQEWGAHVASAGATAHDVPAYAFTHALPFVSKVAVSAFGKTVIASEVTSSPAADAASNATSPARLSQPAAKAVGSDTSGATPKRVRWKLRSLHAVTIPPLSEIGPVSVSIDDGGDVQPQ